MIAAAATTAPHRSTFLRKQKSLGQFFTPPAIADAMVQWAVACRPRSFLDPAVGPGVFLSSLLDLQSSFPAGAVPRITAYDVDPAMIQSARRKLRSIASATAAGGKSLRDRRAQFHCRDFLTARVTEPFDAIVANPPYVRHHEARLPESLFRRFDAQFGLRFSRLTNLYCLFLLKIASCLSSRGRAAVITPVEFLNADYGRAVKEVLLRAPAFAGCILVDPAAPVFDGLLTTACVTLFDAACESTDISIAQAAAPEQLPECLARFDGKARHGGRLGPIRLPRTALDPARKWGSAATFWNRAPAPRVQTTENLRPLSDFARCMRGIATGANDFFTLTDAEVRRWKLPRQALAPCVTKARDATAPRFTRDHFNQLGPAGRRRWLLKIDSAVEPNLIAKRTSAVARYLRHGERLGVHRRYLTRHRAPWYATEQRPPADLWVTVFGRGRMRFVHNAARLLSLTAFHAIYLQSRYRRLIPRLLEHFASDEFHARAGVELRVYGDGLLKVEPRDVERLLIPDLDRWL